MTSQRSPRPTARLLAVCVAFIAWTCSCRAPADASRILHGQNTLLVVSVPPNLDAFVVPQDAAVGPFGINYYTDEKYRVGRTPLQMKLQPGTYSITVVYKTVPFRWDNETRRIFEVTREGLRDSAKIYEVTQVPGHGYLVTALFWEEGQSLAEFAKFLPHTRQFDFAPPSTYEDVFRKANVPPGDQRLLLEMMSRSGKFVWYDTGRATRIVNFYEELKPKVRGSTLLGPERVKAQ